MTYNKLGRKNAEPFCQHTTAEMVSTDIILILNLIKEMEFCIAVEQQCINAVYYVGANLIKLNLFFPLVAQL